MIRTCCLSRLCCSFSLLGVSPVPVTGWQLRAPSATRGTTTWCSALSALLFLASSALASTKGRRAFYEWEVWIAHLLISVWRGCWVAHSGLSIRMKRATRILCNSCNSSKSSTPSLVWLLSLQKPLRRLATGSVAVLRVASSSQVRLQEHPGGFDFRSHVEQWSHCSRLGLVSSALQFLHLCLKLRLSCLRCMSTHCHILRLSRVTCSVLNIHAVPDCSPCLPAGVFMCCCVVLVAWLQGVGIVL